MAFNSKYLKNTKGFTLIELLIVIGIIGILAAIAIPRFTEYKLRSYDSLAKSDLTNIFKVCKAYWADATGTPNCTLAVASSATFGYVQSPNVTLVFNNASEPSFAVTASHTASSNTYAINSAGVVSIQ